MSVIRLTKEFKFEMAHALSGYDGPCRHIHGHSYELLVTVTGRPVQDPGSPIFGMVMDFKELKQIVRSRIVDEFDHSLVLCKVTAPEEISSLGEFVGRLKLVDYQPSSENLLCDFAERLTGALPDGINLHSLKLRETVTSYAEWYAEDNLSR
ncbi:MAG TPA: 6-carboxytetrahydropterin synthase [Lentimicrobium sp.]|jgi:6-pyruvoyltetrahydropterin/6-carboxytetrahydropterin synthase|nr:6-carboxytetrahydropterin synthase [Lentimicrobium sp.]